MIDTSALLGERSRVPTSIGELEAPFNVKRSANLAVCGAE